MCRNPSYWGKLCFLSTPDGENCGLVKNLAVTAIVSSKTTSPMEEHLVSIGMVKLDSISLTDVNKKEKVFLNGDWIGVCSDSADFVSKFRSMRRSKIINPQVSSSDLLNYFYLDISVFKCKQVYLI